MEIGLTDLETGDEYGIEDFARAHDLSVIPEPRPKEPHGPSH